MKNDPITPELRDSVYHMRDTFASILDEYGPDINGLLRVKMAKAELVLNRIALEMDARIVSSR